MKPMVLGISGSPVKNSNTDRMVQAVLSNTNLPTEFIKLSSLRVRPCIACLGCTKDNSARSRMISGTGRKGKVRGGDSRRRVSAVRIN